ncbi:molecular chaperone [Altererythrobacter sp. SALINAS58]|nr:molecular chaperone [Alteripontixanthobacter muriae]
MISAVLPGPVAAQGDLLVAPTRIIMDGRRGTEVILSNIGTEEATYRIGLELRRMTPEGNLVEVSRETASERELAALDMIRYAPRRITLPPGQPQSVRIGARPGADLPDGEYRVHMSFSGIPNPQPLAGPSEEANGISIRLTPIYGVTIPVMVRHGRLEAQIAISDARLVQHSDGSVLDVAITRSGESSTYGELRVLTQGSDEPVAIARGIAIYAELDERRAAIPLSPEQAALLNGPVRIEYREMPESGGALLAAIDTTLN